MLHFASNELLATAQHIEANLYLREPIYILLHVVILSGISVCIADKHAPK